MNLNLTLLGEFVTFIVFVWFTMRYVWPPLMKAITERQAKIADGLAAADQGKRDLELAQHKSLEIIHEAKLQASHIVENANQRAGRIVEEAKDKARDESKRLLDNALNEVDVTKKKLERELESRVTGLSAAMAQKIIKREIDPEAHQDLLYEVIAEMK